MPRRLLTAALLLLLPLPALADGRVALVIGTSRYDQLTDLPNPRSDAAALAEALSDLGFDVTEETNPDTEDLRDALADFAEDAAGADVALVFYAGHGVEIAGENRLLPTDATADSLDALAATSLALTDIARTLATLAPAAILIVDACRNDPFVGTPLADATRAATALEDPSRPIAPGFARVGPAQGLLYAFSTAPGDVASDGPEGANSPFTAALLRHLAKPGLELRTVLTLVTEDVHDRTRGAQTPYFESGLPELVFAAGQPADLSERDALLLAMADLSPALRDQVETLAATRAMPLAPLYAALLTLPPDTPRADRDRALTEAADAYASLQDQLTRLSEADPRVAELRRAAAADLDLGQTQAAQEKFRQAIALDEAGREAGRDLYLARTLSQAETHVLSSNSSLAELDRKSAIQSLKAASELFEVAYQLDSSDATLQMVTETLWAIGEIYHYNLDDIDRALEYYGRMEAVIAAKLKVDPESLRWRRELAAAQNVLGDASMRRDDFEEALKWFSLSAEVSRELFSDDPQNDQYRRDLAVAYIKMSDVTLRLDDVPAAGEFASKAVGLMADRAERMPDSASVLADLASSQERMGDIAYYSSSGEFAAALAAYQLSLENWRRVVLLEPEADIYLRNLATTQGRVGDAQWQLNLLDDAETSYAGSLAALQELANKDPQNMLIQDDLGIARVRLADLMQHMGRLELALEHYRAAHRIYSVLIANDPNNPRQMSSFVDVSMKMGDLLRHLNNSEEATTRLAEALPFADKVLALFPESESAAEDAFFLRVSLAELCEMAGNTDCVLSLMRSAAEVALGIRASSRTPELWSSNAIIAFRWTAEIELSRGNSASASAEYTRALDLALELHLANPESADHQIEVAMAHLHLAQAVADFRPHLAEALRLLRELDDRGKLDADQKQWIGILEAELAALPPAP